MKQESWDVDVVDSQLAHPPAPAAAGGGGGQALWGAAAAAANLEGVIAVVVLRVCV